MTHAIILLLLVSCTQLGQVPDGEDLLRIQKSRNYDPATEVFMNQDRGVIKRWRSARGRWKSFTRWFFKPEGLVPDYKLPEGDPSLANFTAADGKLKTIWLGHSTIMLNIDDNIIMFDPIFSSSASPLPFMVRRYQPPALKLDELPAIDYIVISHDHYDHLDKNTIEHFIDAHTRFLVPLGVGSHLKYWGVPPARITELDWWEAHSVDGLRFVAAPAQHWSGRLPGRLNRTLWASWIVVGNAQRVYFSGDTGYNKHFKEIGNALGPFDVAFLDSGQYNTRWAGSHLLPKYFVQAYHDLRASLYFPIHWAMFCLSTHPWQEPAEKLQLEATAGRIKLATPKLGELIEIGNTTATQAWWQSP